MSDWARYITSADDMRYARDAKFRFVIQNLKQREQARRKVAFTSHADSKQAGKTPTVRDLRDVYAKLVVLPHPPSKECEILVLGRQVDELREGRPCYSELFVVLVGAEEEIVDM